MKKKIVLFFVLFAISNAISSCMNRPSWHLDHISSASHDSMHLVYHNFRKNSPVRLELFQMNGKMDMEISLTRYEIEPFSQGSHSSLVSLMIDGEKFEELIPLSQGNMRLYLSEKMSHLLIDALLQKKDIVLHFDDFEEVIEAENFSKYYEKFRRNAIFIERLIEDLLP